MLDKSTIDSKQLKYRLIYDPYTGLFKWNHPNRRCKRASKGQKAGTSLPSGYVNISVDGRIYPAHRLAWLYMTGEMPDQAVDHINQNTSDNRWCNLRLATRSQNAANSKLRKNNTSGYKGVTWNKRCRKWTAQIHVNGKTIWLGDFHLKRWAIAEYARAAKEYFGEFSTV